MNDLNNVNANILLGASISAAATEKQTREMSKKMQELAKECSSSSQELAAAIREQNYLLSLNEEERKEYFRIKQELEEKRQREAKERAKQEAIERRQREIAERQAAEEKKLENKLLIGVCIAFVVPFLIALLVTA